MKIRYGASLTAPHPTVPYANVKPTLEVELEVDGELRDAALAELREWVHQQLDASVQSLNTLVPR